MTEEQRCSLAASTRPVPRFAADVFDYYMQFYATVLGRRCCACDDALAAAAAVRDVVPRRAATVRVTVDAGAGPARAATVCDLRGQYKGEIRPPGASCTVVLETGGDFPDAVVRRLLRS